MKALLEVAIATRRPPGEHATIFMALSHPSLGLDDWTAEQQIKLLALELATAHPACIMPVRATIIEILEL